MKKKYKRIWGNERFRKLLSLLLVVTLFAGMIPQSVYATGSSAQTQNQVIEYQGEGYEVKAEIVSCWGNYANLDIKIVNKTLHKMEDWQLEFDAPFTWSNIWNAAIVEAATESDAQAVTEHSIIKGADWNKDIGLFGSVSFGGTVYCEAGAVSLPEAFSVTDKKAREEAEKANAEEKSENQDTETSEEESENQDAEESEENNQNQDSDTEATEDKKTTSKLPYQIPKELEGLQYAIFSGSRNGIAVCSNETKVNGDVLSNGRFTYSGTKLHISGSLNAATNITTNTSSMSDALYIGTKNENVPVLDMPDLTKILDEKLLNEKEKNLLLNDSEIYLTDALVAEENIEIAGTSFTGEGIVYAGKNIVYNVGSMDTIPSGSLLLCAKEGNITLNGSTFELNGVLYAPNGCVTINAYDVKLNGRIIADTICLNGTYFNICAGEYDFDMIREWIESDDGNNEESGDESDNENNDESDDENNQEPEEEPVPTLQAEIIAGGNTKQNRKVVLEIQNSGELEFTDELNATWSITKVGREEVKQEAIGKTYEETNGKAAELTEQSGILSSDCLLVDDAVSTNLHKELLFREAGTYTVQVSLQQNDETITLEKELVIEKDRAPEAGFAFTQDFFVRDENKTATISVSDSSFSLDGDEIGKRTWQIIYDANRDGVFDEEPEIISDGNETQITYQTRKLGQYKVILTVTEDFKDTIEKFITEECYQRDDTDDMTETSCIVSVLNEAPEASFEIEKLKKADIIFTSGHASKEQVDYCNEQIESLKKELEAQGVDVRTTTVETSALTAKDSFAWREYDHYNMREPYGDRQVVERHITYDDSDIRIIGYTAAACKDFLFIPDNNSNTKVLQFDLQKDNNNWHTIEGGGFLFNTEIDEEKDLINGFSILLSSNGIKIMQMDHLSLSKFRNAQALATCIKMVKLNNVLEKKNFRVQVDDRSITVWCNGEAVLLDFVLPECTSYGYGPILSNDGHSCGQISYFDFENIKMSTVIGENLNDTIDDYDWREGAQRYVIHMSDVEIPELSTDEALANTVKAVIEDDINMMIIGNEVAGVEAKKLMNTSEKGMLVSYDNLSTSMEEIKEYICSDMERKSAMVGDFLSTDDILSYKIQYKDKENDDLYKSEWTYEATSLSSNDLEVGDMAVTTCEYPIEQFNQTGAYMVRLRVQDNPRAEESENIDLESIASKQSVSWNTTENYFGSWSKPYEYPGVLLVQTKPEAQIETKLYKDASDAKKCAIHITTAAFDIDHTDEDGQGIIGESLMYKEVNEPEWTEGTPKYSLPVGSVYLFKYQVQDKEKSYSYPKISVVNTNDIKEFEPYEDTTKPEIQLSVSKEEISLGEPIQITAFAQDENVLAFFGIYYRGSVVSQEQGLYTFIPDKVGNHSISVGARDVAGNISYSTVWFKVVDKDLNPPQIQVDSISQQSEDVDRLIFTGTIQDDKALKEYKISYRNTEEEYTEIYSSQDAVSANTIAALDVADFKDGEYEFLITAEDETGNKSYYSTYYTLSRETVDGERRIWIDEVLLNQEKEQIEVYGTLIQKDETETVSCNCIRTENQTPVNIVRQPETENGLLAVIPTEGLETGHYEVSFTLTAQNGDFTKVSSTFAYTCGSEGSQDDVVVDNNKESTTEEKASITLELSKTEANIGTEIIARIKQTGSISENSLKLTADEKEIPLSDGKATLTSDTPKQMTLCAEAYAENGEYIQAFQSCSFVDQSDKTAPKVSFKGADEEGNLYLTITEPTELIGSVSDDKELLSYQLEYRLKGQKDYILLAQGNEEKKEEVLAKLDTTVLMNGVYEVRLTALDAGGNKSSAVCICAVEGTLKIGELSIGFTDLKTTMPFGNLNINRMYDSRNLIQGDFGYGWNLGLAGMSIQETADFDKGYRQVRAGSGLATVYCLEERYFHDVVVSYGDGTSDRFRMNFAPQTKRWLPIEEVEVNFVCVTNPNLKLALAGDNSALVNGDELVWLGSSGRSDSYILTLEDETRVYLSKTKGVTKTIDATGNTMTYSKDGFMDENGKGVTFARDYYGRIKQITDDYGHTRTYTYDEDGNLSTYTDQAGNTVTYTYDTAHRLVQIIDPSGIAVSRYEYDENGRLVAVIDAEGNRVAYNHDLSNRTEIVTDRRGYATIYEYDANGNVISTTDAEGNTTRSTYDANGNLLTETDALGNTKSYTYDENENITTTTDAAGNVSNATYNSKNQVTSLKNMDGIELICDYDERGLLTSTQDTEGNVTTYTYDPNGQISGITDELGQVAVYTYDANGNLIKTLDGEGDETTYTYDKNGNCTYSTQRKANRTGQTTVTTRYTYDDAGRVIQTNSSSGSITRTSYNENGNIATTTDAEGRVTTYTHTPNGDVETITYYDGTSEHFTYDEEGNVLTQTDRLGLTTSNTYDKVGNLLTSTDALGNVTKYEYDAAYHLTKVTSPTGVETTYQYDVLGRNTEIQNEEGIITYTYDAYSNVTSMTDVLGNTTHYEYDNLGRRTEVVLPDGTKMKTAYDVRGNITSQTDAEGNTTKYEYDNNNNLTNLTNPEGETTTYNYNGAGELLTVTDANGNTTSYDYNVSGQVIREMRADGKYRQYAYRASGDLSYMADYDGTRQNYIYRNNQLAQISVGSEYSQYTYDDYQRILTVKDKQGTISYTYDTYGRVASRTTAVGEEIKYGYDTYGRLNEVTTSEGTIRYEYDKYDRLIKVEDKEGEVTTYAYDKNGNKSEQENSDGTKIVYGYDVCNRLISEVIRDKDGKLLADYHYTYNGNGQKIRAEEKVKTPDGAFTTVKVSYEYDKANRLTGETTTTGKLTATENEATETKTESIAYTYDEVGNRIKKLENGILTEYTYNELNQLVTETSQDEVIAYAYDVNGNLLCRGTDDTYDIYTYTKANRLESVASHTPSGETVEHYVYDGEGNRLKKNVTKTKFVYETGEDANTELTVETISESITYYVMDTITGYSQVLMELDENKEAKVLYTRGDGLVSREQLLTNGETKTSLYLSDGHGDVRQLTDTNGNITDTYRYNAYGELAERTGNTDNPYLYTGEYYDEGTGLYYLRARYMNPETGTFISMDTYRGNSYDPASLHRYTYAQNNPQMYNDPSGHFAGLIGAQVNLTCSEILRNHQALHMMGMVNGMMNSILNQVLGTGSDPVKDFLLGYVTGYGLGAAYVGASIIGALYELQVLLGLVAFHLGFVNSVNEIKIAMAIGFGAAGNNKEAIIHLTLAVVSLVAAMFALRMTGTILAEGPKGVVGFDVDGGSESGTDSGINNKRLYRVMSEAELDAVKSTGMLRGGREGTTYFTDSYFKNANKAKSRLALPQKPSYIVEFEINNNPNISGGTKVQSAFGEKGGGREYFTDDIVEVFIVNYQKMIGGR